MRTLYTLLLYIALPWMFLRLLWKSRRLPEYRQRWPERLGFCPHSLEKCIWVHAVSVGETLAAVPLMKALKKLYPDIPLLVTNMTPTGAARVKVAMGDQVYQCYVPYDFPDALNRFLKRVNPVVAIIMETELWPNLFAACQKRQIPLVVTNARLSEKSAQGYQRIASVTADMLSAVTVLASQGYADAERFIQLGLAKEKVHVTGNLKFDLELPLNLFDKSQQLKTALGNDRLIWIAASTHPMEEEIVLAAHQKIREQYPNALLILVPRHPDRFDSVAHLITQQHFKLARRSQNDIVNSDVEVYLADTMGELLLLYSVCDVALVAGSFAMIGGHNMLEAAALSKPIITGPQLFNFSEISDMLLLAKGMIKVENTNELTLTVKHFFADADYRKQTGEKAFSVIENNRGALQKQIDLIQAVLEV